MAALAAASVDLDSLWHYCRIQGLSEDVLPPQSRDAIYQVALPRFLELFESVGMKATLFAIGEDLASPEAASALREAAATGYEIGNHSFHHDYALSRQEPIALARDVEEGAAAIERAVGKRPAGFRAPGYTLSPALYQAVCAAGHRYDSSTFPATPYYAAKAAVMGTLAALRRPSRAILDTPRVLLAPREPYLPDPLAPYARGSGPAIELPISVAPFSRFPFIGTFVATLPRSVIRAAYRSLRGSPLLNFELHGIDLLDESDGLPPALARQQRDVRVPASIKLGRLREVLLWMRHDFETVTLEQAAATLAPHAAAVV